MNSEQVGNTDSNASSIGVMPFLHEPTTYTAIHPFKMLIEQTKN